VRVRIGVTLPQFTDDPRSVLDAARRAEALGLDSIWVFDHLWPLSGGKQRPVLECWTTLAWLASVTESVTVGTLVTRSSLRAPALVAKMAGTVGDVAPGRVVVALGSGDRLSRPENEAFGIPYASGAERVAQLETTVEVLDSYRRDSTVTHERAGLRGLPASPRPVPPVRLWVAGRSPSAIALAGRTADGWNGWGSTPEELAADIAALRRAAGGRAVEATWAGLVLLGASDAEARRKLGRRAAAAYVMGGAEAVAERLGRLADAGADHLVLTFPDASDPETYALLARAVIPLLTS
jgi:alkanesulfonate monooxygenase SsuD/methylene tetrahydromethanopterin reductase-like flavin-dependent oxidoreductase (luciferase family)